MTRSSLSLAARLWVSACFAACVSEVEADVTRLALRAPQPAYVGSIAPDADSIAPGADSIAPDAGAAAEAGCTGAGCAAAPEYDLLRGCAMAEVIAPEVSQTRVLLSRHGSTSSAQPTSESSIGNCRGSGQGPDVWYELDLRSLPGPVEFRATLDAAFDAVLDLRRGACGDTLSLDCDRANALGRSASRLVARLEPGAYWLVVDGASAADHGEFTLQIELDPELGDCEAQPANQACDTATPLEAVPFQSLLLDTSCEPPEKEGNVTLYYALDLSREPAPVLATTSLSRPGEIGGGDIDWHSSESGAACAELPTPYPRGGNADKERQTASLLSPARYVLAVALPTEDIKDPRAELNLRLDREACRGGAVANGCTDAIELDASSAAQLLEGSTLCNQNTIRPSCGDDSPEQLYRLDLRQRSALTRVRATVLADGLDFLPVLYLLPRGEAESCGEVVYCSDPLALWEGLPWFDLTLSPELFWIGVDGWEPGAAGHYRMLVELSPTERSPCITAAIEDCAYREYDSECCFASSVACSRALELCGLEPATRECVCQANPACCGPDVGTTDCTESYRTCGYLCPEFAPSESACY